MDAKNGYKIIFVDLGKTLCAFDHSVRLRAISAASGVAINRVQAEIWASGFDDKCDSGAYARTEICDAIRDRLSIQTVDQRLAELWVEAFTLNRNLWDVLIERSIKNHVIFLRIVLR